MGLFENGEYFASQWFQLNDQPVDRMGKHFFRQSHTSSNNVHSAFVYSIYIYVQHCITNYLLIMYKKYFKSPGLRNSW